MLQFISFLNTKDLLVHYAYKNESFSPADATGYESSDISAMGGPTLQTRASNTTEEHKRLA